MVLKRAEDSGTVEKGKERRRERQILHEVITSKVKERPPKPTRAFERARKTPEESKNSFENFACF